MKKNVIVSTQNLCEDKPDPTGGMQSGKAAPKIPVTQLRITI